MIFPRVSALTSETVIFVPEAEIVLKLLVVLLKVMLPGATKFAVPVTVRFEPLDWVMAPLVKLTVRLLEFRLPSSIDCE